ncbi:hypothetical protein JCM10212_000013 [Sporobolomyces blumeae]
MSSTSRLPASSEVEQLVSLGIPRAKALYALKEFEGNAEVAADWCFTEGAEWTPNDLLQTKFGSSGPSAQEVYSADDEPPPSAPRVRKRGDFSSRLTDQGLPSASSATSTSRTDPRGRRQVHTPPGWTLVPHRLVPRGTRVSITLKQDQGTDRTVEGVVDERLTKGDHPRGVKVRLTDGRVGRVVRILPEVASTAPVGRSAR